MATTEIGHHVKMVYRDQAGRLVVPSSASIIVEAGGLLCAKPSTGGIGAMCATGIANTLSNRGVTILKTTDSVGVDVLSQPTKDTVGSYKTIIWDTTAKRKLRLATAAGLRDVRCGSSSASVIVTTTDLGKLAHLTYRGYGLNASITLLAASTDRWVITGISPATTAGAKYWVLSSCT
ncbi:MAG: hypothetical protein V1897_03295 [Pseudomonadota bacterium]